MRKFFTSSGLSAGTHQAFLGDDLIQGVKPLEKLRFPGRHNDLQQTSGAWEKVYCFSIAALHAFTVLTIRKQGPLSQRIPWQIIQLAIIQTGKKKDHLSSFSWSTGNAGSRLQSFEGLPCQKGLANSCLEVDRDQMHKPSFSQCINSPNLWSGVAFCLTEQGMNQLVSFQTEHPIIICELCARSQHTSYYFTFSESCKCILYL
jgi:hypothetical protein